jgi:crotonobetainyl-CoA:carnitine CoA-transferase CaiB-like acyl-CoA transferase
MRPGVDMLLQAETGLLTGLRGAGGRPQLIASTIVDGASGHVLAQAVLAALLHRERHGIADRISIALYDVACSLQANFLTVYLNRSADHRVGSRQRRSSRIATVPSGVFRASDGYFVLSAYVDKHWRLLTQVVGRPELAEDTRFSDQRRRAENVDTLLEILDSVFSSRTVQEWLEALQPVGVMAVPILSWEEVVNSAVFQENELSVTTTSADTHEITIRTPARYASFSPAADQPTPALGASNDALLSRRSSDASVREGSSTLT